MPYTVNGIGTTYAGAWNRQTQDGVCAACNRRVKLVNYETWHCICVLFIPLIPLGKKQILDYCPSCTQHRVLPYRDWVKIRDEAINDTATQLSSSPDDPDAAVQMHATLDAFQKQADAQQLAEMLETKFSDVARVQFYLAAWYERTGKTAIANRLFLRAYELDQNDVSFRRAALLTYVEEGNVDQAKSMIQPFLPGTEHFDASIFYVLATGFQKQERHAEAVQTLRMLLDAAPGLKTDKTFRKTLAISEKALGVEELTIPSDPFYQSSAFLWTMGTTAVVAAIALWNLYIAQNRNVTVVNGLRTPITVVVDGQPPLQIASGTKVNVTLAEGRHDAEVTVPANLYPKVMFDLSTAWWERFFRRPVFVLDPTKSAAVLWEEATYVAPAAGVQAPEPQVDLRLGESFTSHNHVDYQFAEFPDSIKVKKTSKVVKTRLTVLNEDVAELVYRGLSFGKLPASMLPFLETHLKGDPDRDDLLQAYAALSMQADKIGQCRDFLKERLADRPVRVSWHRMYQSLSTRGLPSKESHQVHQRLIADYDAMLEKEPKDPSLLYLRGRLEGHGQKSAPYFERALAADPNHAYALYATSRTRLLGGDFETALELLTKAIAIRPKDPAFQISQSTYRFAAGDLQTLEKSAREDLTRTPLSTQAMETILKFLVVSNRVDEADREYMAFKTRFQQIVPGRFHSNLDTLKYMLESIKGDFAKLQIALGNSIDPNAKPFEFAAKLELGQLAEAPETLANDGGYWTLCRELVARRLADEAQVTASRETALMMLDKANDSDWAVADVLRRSKAATWDEIADLSCDANHKAVVLVVLAHERPDLKAQLLDLAEKLNFDLEFPHYLIKREIEELRQK